MATGSLTWACLLLAATSGGGADDVMPMKVRAFRLPIRVQPQRLAEVHHVVLYLSRDQGKTWEMYGRQAPDKPVFDFTAPEDGTYWFCVATVDHRGAQDPPDIRNAQQRQKVLIDTTKPDVRLNSLERQGDEVRVGLSVSDLNPDWTTLKLEYRAGDSAGGEWIPVAVDPADTTKTFRPAVAGDLVVRLMLKDVAGNEGVAEKRLSAGSGAADRDHGIVAAGGIAAPPPSIDAGPAAKPASASVPPSPPLGGTTPERTAPAPLAGDANPPPPEAARRDGPAPVAESSATSNPTASSGDAPLPKRLGRLPELRIVNKRQVKLDFEVSKFGPSGLGSVEVYVTTNEGASWELMPGDHNLTLPPAPEGRGGQGPVHGSVSVPLEQEGVAYGFYLVVKSRAGLGKPPPHPGIAPHIRLEADTTQPKAQLFAPQPAKDQRDALELTWKAEDKNLEASPVTLEWSANRDGPWSPIGEPQMANTGRHVWQIPPQTPPKVYLKLTVRDAAGNIAVAQTANPVLIDLQEPELGNVTFSTP
jgi:hypothetical protein